MFWYRENSVCVLDAPTHNVCANSLFNHFKFSVDFPNKQLSNIANICHHSKSFPWVFNWLMVPSMLQATVHAKRLIILNKFIFSRHNSMPTAIQLPNGQWFSCLANKWAICKWPAARLHFHFAILRRDSPGRGCPCESLLVQPALAILCSLAMLGWLTLVTVVCTDSPPGHCISILLPPLTRCDLNIPNAFFYLPLFWNEYALLI